MKEKLNKIAEQYKKEYNLNTRIDIVKEGEGCYYRRSSDNIFLSIDCVYRICKTKTPFFLKKRSGYITFKHNLIHALLHELKHAIDHKNNTIGFDKEVCDIDLNLYNTDTEYHISRPFEKRADDFARKELEKWI